MNNFKCFLYPSCFILLSDSTLFGFFFTWIWDYIFTIFIKEKNFVFRLIFSFLLFLVGTGTYFYLCLIVFDASFSLYLIIVLLIGNFLYLNVYQKYVKRHIFLVKKRIEKLKQPFYNQIKRWESWLRKFYDKSRKKKKKHLELPQD